MAIEFPISTGDIVEIVLPQRVNGQIMMNVLHYQAEGAVSQSQGKQAVDDLMAVILQPEGIRHIIAKFQHPGVIHQVPTSQMIHVTRRLKMRHDTDTQLGEATGAELPQNVALSVTKRGLIANRNNVGRIQIGGLAVNMVLEGHMSGSAFALAEDLAELLDDSVNVGGATWHPVIYNRTLPNQSVRLVHAFPEETVRVQRTRTVGRGI